MPKKRVKKGGGGRQGGLTEEERLLYTKQRAQAEEEMAKRKEEMLTQFLKDKLQKEEKNSAVNLHKLTQQWRTVLRQTRATELRKDIDVSMQTFERVLDHKNSVIKCLVSDLHEAEQQSAQALRSHLCYVESLRALQTDRLASHEEQWNDGQQELSSEFNSEREKLLSLHQQEFVYLEDVTFAMEQRYGVVVGEARQDYQSTRDEIKNRHIKEKHDLRHQLEGSVKTLWCQYQQAQQSYKEATEDRRIAYESLRARDQCSAQEIESQTHTLQKMQDSIATLRASLSSNQRESEAAARELRAGREKVTLQTRQLKAQMSRAHASERSRLTDLVIHSNTAAKKLQDIVAKGEKLLRRAEMCSKLESDREKVLPFYMSSLTLEEEDQVRAQAMDPPGEELAKAMTDYWDLERFWQRYNKVLLERLSLEKEESVLTQENQQLQALLRQYLDGISVSDNVLRQRNPLLMVSQHTLTVPAIAERQRKRHTVIEAAHVVQQHAL